MLATDSSDGTVRLWDARASEAVAILRPLEDDGYAVLLPGGAYKLHGDPRGALWWAVKLARFEPGELDEFIPSIRRLPPEAPILDHRS